MSNNVRANIVTGTSKNGNNYTAVQFSIMTSQGEYRTPLIFPTNLEINLIKEALNPVKGIYGDTSPETEGF